MKGYKYRTEVYVTTIQQRREVRIVVVRTDDRGYDSSAFERIIGLPQDLDEADEALLGLETGLDMLRAALVIARDEASRTERAARVSGGFVS